MFSLIMKSANSQLAKVFFSKAQMNFVEISTEETVQLRHSVLWPDKPTSYVLLPEDNSGIHLGAILPNDSSSTGHAPVAVISLFREALPEAELESAGATAEPAARFRKFACDPAHQGHGVGTSLLQFAFQVARSRLGCSVVWCDARLETVGWYERRGMKRFGEHFFKGNVEYVRMKVSLGQ